MQELESDFTAMYNFPLSLLCLGLLECEKTRFPEIREICIQQLANTLCGMDRVDTIKNLMSALRSSIQESSEYSIHPETRGAIFDMLAKGYTQTSRIPYTHSVSRIIRSAPYEHLTLDDSAAQSAR